METLDWTRLATDVVPQRGKIPYTPNKHLFTKIAFDVFQFNNSPVESLWILEKGDDGQEYLVAQYGEDDSGSAPLESKSHWETLVDKKGENVTLIYKDFPIQRFASSDHGFTKDDVYLFQKTLVAKLSSDKSFLEKFLKSQPEEKRKSLLAQFPELA